MARAFYSMRVTWVPVLTGTIMTVIFVALNWVLMNAMMHCKYGGHSGLALATTIAAFGDMLLLLYFLRIKAGGINVRRILLSLTKITAASQYRTGLCGDIIKLWEMLLLSFAFKLAAAPQCFIPMAV